MAVQKVYSLRIQSRTDRGQRALAWGPTKPHTLPFQERSASVIAPCRSSSQQMSAPSLRVALRLVLAGLDNSDLNLLLFSTRHVESYD